MPTDWNWIDEWEYLVERIVRKEEETTSWEENLTEELDARGKEGWQLVSLDQHDRYWVASATFKRKTGEATRRVAKE